MQEQTELLNTVSTQLGLNVNRNKTRIKKANTKNNNTFTLNGEPLEETDSFTYLGSTINKNGGTEEDVKARIQKARVAFIILRTIWRANKSKLTPNWEYSIQMSRQFYSMDWRLGKVHGRHQTEYRLSSTNASAESYTWSGQTRYPTLHSGKLPSNYA